MIVNRFRQCGIKRKFRQEKYVNAVSVPFLFSKWWLIFAPSRGGWPSNWGRLCLHLHLFYSIYFFGRMNSFHLVISFHLISIQQVSVCFLWFFNFNSIQYTTFPCTLLPSLSILACTVSLSNAYLWLKVIAFTDISYLILFPRRKRFCKSAGFLFHCSPSVQACFEGQFFSCVLTRE